MMGYRMLLVSADKDLARVLSALAPDAHYAWQVAGTATAGLEAALKQAPELVVLDLDVPDMRGLDCLRILRSTAEGRELPVIAVDGRKSDDEVREAFDWGADDFVLKDCDPLEWAARLRAVLRRRFERQPLADEALALGSVTLDPVLHECRVRGRLVALRPREFELLETLMRKAGRVLSRQYLLETVWGMSRLADTRSVDVAVSRLRKALGRRASAWVETVERFGYRFRRPEPRR